MMNSIKIISKDVLNYHVNQDSKNQKKQKEINYLKDAEYVVILIIIVI